MNLSLYKVRVFQFHLIISLLSMLLILTLSIIDVSAQKTERMNVLFIISDDLCNNSMLEAATPHMDRLASMSMNFSQAYCQYPVCCPSRNSFLSGLRPDAIGAKWAPLREFVPDVTTLPQLFRENGYYTASIGKVFHVDGWDARWPDEGWKYCDAKSWDFRINCPPANQGPRRMPPFPRKGIRLEWPGHSGPIDYGMISFESDLAQDDGQATQEAIRQLDLPLDKPFFLAVGYRRPHAPFVAPEAYFTPYPLSSMQLPDPGDRSDVTDLAFNVVPPNYGDPEAMKKMKMCYLASVSFLDSQVGRLLQSLEEHGLMEKTIIIFFSDHGFQLGEHGEWHKNNLYEETARVPLMIRIPGITTAGVVSNTLVELIDLYPTLKEYCGMPDPNQKLYGRSLIPLLKNPDTKFEELPAITQVSRKISATENAMGYSIRYKKFRYNEWWTVEEKPSLIATELYDLTKDPASEVNESENNAYKSTRNELSTLLAKYRSKR
jgi:iduronate 2-sulfatase